MCFAEVRIFGATAVLIMAKRKASTTGGPSAYVFVLHLSWGKDPIMETDGKVTF